MKEVFSRTSLMLGEDAMEKLKGARVIIFGVGGVGSYAFEALIRSGVYDITLVDNDVVSKSNINRQLIATHESVGKKKVEVAMKRGLDINPEAKITPLELFYSEETKEKINLNDYDYVIDAIDTVSSKILLIESATRLGVKIISSMGAGNKIDPTRFEVSDIHKTSVCPLARVVRQRLKALGIKKLKCVYSKETPFRTVVDEDGKTRHAPASIATAPSAAGLIIASEVIRDIIGL